VIHPLDIALDSFTASPRFSLILISAHPPFLEPLPGKDHAEVNDMSLKIMIVDDEPVSVRLVRSLAAPLNHTVLALQDSQEAGQRADKQRFDVVFVGMGGIELTRRIRNSQPNRETTIVVLSATEDIESLREAFGEGADLVLTKPISAVRLRPMLAAMDSPGWQGKRHAARLPLFTEVNCTWGDRQFPLRSMNISQSGMLLQPSLDVEVGQEVSLDFKITEVRATLNVRARIVRKEGTLRVAIEFISLAPEDQNAIQLYVMGRLVNGQTPTREPSRSWWLGQGFLN